MFFPSSHFQATVKSEPVQNSVTSLLYFPSSPAATARWSQEYLAAPLATSAPPASAPASASAATASRKRAHDDSGAEPDQQASKKPRLHDEATSDEPQCRLTQSEWTQHSTLKQTTTTTVSARANPTRPFEQDTECPICQETVFWCAPTSGDTAAATITSTTTGTAERDLVEWSLVRHECGNTFRSTCLESWCVVRQNGATTCPMCRGVVVDPPAPAAAHNEDENLRVASSGLDADLQLELFGGVDAVFPHQR